MCAPRREKNRTDRPKNQKGESLCGHRQGSLTLVGIGPGDRDSLSPRAYRAICGSEIIVGYRVYLQLINELLTGKEVISSGMTQELGRAQMAIEKALAGRHVCLVSSGDAGIYGMAGVILELLKEEEAAKVKIEIIPGITAASSCASLLGAPLMNDFAAISLSDLLTDLGIIEKRIKAACQGDFVIVFYNPKSKKRTRPFETAWQILMKHRSPQTPVGIVRNAGRVDQEVVLTSLGKMATLKRIDMGTTVIVGNSRTYTKGRYMITPRGYDKKEGYPAV